MPLLSSALSTRSQHHLFQEPAGSEHSAREDGTQEQGVQETLQASSDNTEVQEPVVPDSNSEELPRVPKYPIVTILPRPSALFNSRTVAHLQPHLPPYQSSFWTDACLRGPKPANVNGLCGLCVVHRRFDKGNPSDRDFAVTWWQSCFVTRNVHQVGHAEMLAVAQALEMAVDQCERISGAVVTKARKKCEIEEIKRRAATIHWPMPKVVNVFKYSSQALESLDCCWLSNRTPSRRSPMTHAIELIEALSALGVRVHLQWVPGHTGDVRNRWAHEGARNALKPQFHGRKVYTKKVHLVQRKPYKDKSCNMLLHQHFNENNLSMQQNGETVTVETIIPEDAPSAIELERNDLLR